MNRRSFICRSFGLAGLVFYPLTRVYGHDAPLNPLKLDESAWHARLSPQQFHIMRQGGTEAPWSSLLNDEKRTGTYHCAGCKLALFSSTKKYESGTGWPSFYESIPGHLETKIDFKLIYPRTEYHCAQCKSHQGHLFNDGPKPTGKRWCNNGLALMFLADPD